MATDKNARRELASNVPVVSWEEWHDVDRAGDPSQFARALTTTVLAGAATYTQDAIDRFARTTAPTAQELGILLVDRVRGLVWADQAGTLYLDQSDNADMSAPVTTTQAVTASTTTELAWTTVTKRYYRFRYVNGATIQTVFRLYQMVGSAEATGTKADTAATDSTSSWSVVALLKGIWAKLAATLNVTVTGSNVAHDAVDSENPIKIGGKASTSAPTAVVNGDRVDGWWQTDGSLNITPRLSNQGPFGAASGVGDGGTGSTAPIAANLAYNGTAWDRLRSVNTGQLVVTLKDTAGVAPTVGTGGTDGTTPNMLNTTALMYGHNNTNLDRWRNNVKQTYLAQAARTAIAYSIQFTLYNGQGITLNLNVNAKAAATTLSVGLEMYDAAALAWAQIGDGGSVAATAGSNYQFVFAPGAVDADYTASVVAKSVRVPREYRVFVNPSDANSVTASLYGFEHS